VALNRNERKAMSIRSTLVPTLMVATTIATLGIQVAPAFAGGSPGEGFTPGTGDKTPTYYSGDGSLHQGRPPNAQPLTPAQQNDWFWGGSHE
jgi:hypothetical protein